MNTIELAVKMETDAIRFYTEAAGKTKNPVGKKMFLTVAEDEKRHLEMVNRIVKGLDISYKEASPMKNVRTVFESLKSELMKRVEATSDELESFKIAMNMEKEGIEFYKKVAGSVKTEKERELFGKLIKEEEQHYSIFSNTYFHLSNTGSWFMWEERSIVEG